MLSRILIFGGGRGPGSGRVQSRLKATTGGGICAPSAQSAKLKHFWTKVTLNVPKLQQLCINILLLTMLWGGGGGKYRCLGEKLPPPPPLDRTLHILCPTKSVGELTLGAGDMYM